MPLRFNQLEPVTGVITGSAGVDCLACGEREAPRLAAVLPAVMPPARRTARIVVRRIEALQRTRRQRLCLRSLPQTTSVGPGNARTCRIFDSIAGFSACFRNAYWHVDRPCLTAMLQ